MPDERLRHDQFRAATVPRRPVKRLFATIFVIVLCFCAICGKVLLDARQAAWERAAEFANSLAVTIESDIARNIESYDLSLRAVIDNLAHPEITKITPELRQLILFDRSAMAKHLDAIVLLDENGIIRLIPGHRSRNRRAVPTGTILNFTRTVLLTRCTSAGPSSPARTAPPSSR